MDQLFSVEGKVILVTGGLGQLGRQYVKTLLGRGARVGILDQQVASSEMLRDIFGNTSDGLLTLQVDILNRGQIETAVSQVVDRFGKIDGLINNAALDSPPGSDSRANGPFEDYPEELWDQVMDVNAKGVFLCCQVVGQQMIRQKGGSIVNIGSIYGMVSPDQKIYDYRRKKGENFFKPLPYSASKSAVLNMTRYLSVYWADKGIRVNTLSLAGVFNRQDDDFLQAYCSRIPLGRMADESDFNGAVVFLMSEASRYMTGANMVIDGGWTAI